MSGRPVFVLHRPWAPAPLAESVQVVSAGHALAALRPVTVAVRASEDVDAATILARFGLAPRDGFRLIVLPRRGAAASAAFWAAVAAWRVGVGRGGLFLGRTPRYLQRVAGSGVPQVAEVHGGPGWERAFAGCVGAICNSEGTLRQVGRIAPGLRARVVRNATRGPGPPLCGAGDGIGYVGSVRVDKDIEVLARLAERSDAPVVVVGPDAAAARRLGGALRVEGPLAPARVPERLAAFACLVLPLGEGTFADEETCPLKLWDYLASGRPVVVADAPTMAFLPGWVPRYRRGDADDLQRAIRVAVGLADRFAARPLVRTWSERAAEVDAFLTEVAP